MLKGLAALARASLLLRTLSLDLRANTMVDIAAAITLHFPELRELSLTLLRPTGTPTPDIFADFNPGWELSVGFLMDDNEREYRAIHRNNSNVDERTVDLSDTDTLGAWEPPSTIGRQPYTNIAKFVSNRAERKALLSNPAQATRAVVSLPVVLLPGHMYGTPYALHLSPPLFVWRSSVGRQLCTPNRTCGFCSQSAER